MKWKEREREERLKIGKHEEERKSSGWLAWESGKPGDCADSGDPTPFSHLPTPCFSVLI